MNQTQSSETVLCEQDTQQIVRCQAGAEHLLGELTRLVAARNALLGELAALGRSGV